MNSLDPDMRRPIGKAAAFAEATPKCYLTGKKRTYE